MDRDNNLISIASMVTVAAGLWLVISTLLFQLSGTIFWSQLISGALLIMIGGSEFYTRVRWTSWAAGAVGIWLVVSSFMLDTSAAVFWNAMVVSLIVFVMAIWDGSLVGRHLPPAHQ